VATCLCPSGPDCLDCARHESDEVGGLVDSCILVLDALFGKERILLPKNFFQALDKSMRSITSVAAACACSGIIVGIISLTGLVSSFLHSWLPRQANRFG